MKKICTVFLTTAVLAIGSPTLADENASKLNALATQQMQRLLSNPLVVESISAQNKKHASLSSDDIDNLDKTWRAGTDGGDTTLIDTVLGTPLSAYLEEVLEEAGGLYSEIFVMDSRGLNVGQSGLTSDYWQGDESKWQKTYMVGPTAVHISETEFDESSQTYQNQVSVSVIDPVTQEVIGAATFGVNADALEYASADDLN